MYLGGAQSRTVQCAGSRAELQCNCRSHRFLKRVDDYCLVVATRFRSMEIHTSIKLIRACWDGGLGLLGSNASGAIEGLFYRCFQVSWAKTIDLHQIMAAWRESAISPQDKTVMRAVTLLSTVSPTRIVLATLETTRTLQALNRAVRMVLVEGDKAFLKVSKAFAEMEAENVLLRK